MTSLISENYKPSRNMFFKTVVCQMPLSLSVAVFSLGRLTS